MNESVNYCTEPDWRGLHEVIEKAIKKNKKSAVMAKGQ